MKTLDDILRIIVRCDGLAKLCSRPATCCAMNNIAYDMAVRGEYYG